MNMSTMSTASGFLAATQASVCTDTAIARYGDNVYHRVPGAVVEAEQSLRSGPGRLLAGRRPVVRLGGHQTPVHLHQTY